MLRVLRQLWRVCLQKDDLAILCHRHTTSKLVEFEDLQTIATLGFRGEALASISFVSNMTVTTMTAADSHGWRQSYKVHATARLPRQAARGATLCPFCEPLE